MDAPIGAAPTAAPDPVPTSLTPAASDIETAPDGCSHASVEPSDGATTVEPSSPEGDRDSGTAIAEDAPTGPEDDPLRVTDTAGVEVDDAGPVDGGAAVADDAGPVDAEATAPEDPTTGVPSTPDGPPLLRVVPDGPDGDATQRKVETDVEAHEPTDGERARRWRTVAQVAAWSAAVIAVAVVLLVFVFPTRTYLNQRHQVALASSQLRLLNQQNAELSAEVARLQTDSEIEKIAREQYHLVRPGESAFAILPAPTPATLPPAPTGTAKPSSGLWHRITAWLP